MSLRMSGTVPWCTDFVKKVKERWGVLTFGTPYAFLCK